MNLSRFLEVTQHIRLTAKRLDVFFLFFLFLQEKKNKSISQGRMEKKYDPLDRTLTFVTRRDDIDPLCKSTIKSNCAWQKRSQGGRFLRVKVRSALVLITGRQLFMQGLFDSVLTVIRIILWIPDPEEHTLLTQVLMVKHMWRGGGMHATEWPSGDRDVWLEMIQL